jgi:hypothetical protein
MSAPKANRTVPAAPSAPGSGATPQPARVPPGREEFLPAKSSPGEPKKGDEQEAMSAWLKDLARQERDRLSEIEKFNQAAGPFLAALYERILSDLDSYRKEFPGVFISSNLDAKQGFIEVTNHSRGNPAPQVRISTNSADQTLRAAFEFRKSLNKELPMGMVEGKLAVDVNGVASAEVLPQLMLTPVLFPELTSNTLLYDSLTGNSGLR